MGTWARTAPVGARIRLANIIDFHADACAREGSRLYSYLLRRVAEDVTVGGAFGPLLLGHAHDRFASAPLSRLMASVHRIVLEGRAPELALHYPSVGGWFDAEVLVELADPDAADVLVFRDSGSGLDPWPAFVETVLVSESEISAYLDLPDQTNDVTRSAGLLAGFLRVADLCPMPMRLLEIGASAGLNLRWDQLRYESPQWSFGPKSSPVRLCEPWLDRAPVVGRAPEIIERRGCDVLPIDPTSVVGRRMVRSFIRPDDMIRLSLVDRACSIAADHPVTIDAANAAAWLPEQLQRQVPGAVTVVFHSMLWSSLSPLEQDQIEATVTTAGGQATPDAPVAWLRLESIHGRPVTRLTCWPHQAEKVVARGEAQGPQRWKLSA